MQRRNKILILLGLAFILLFLAGFESYQLFHGLRHISAPTHETREPFPHGIHGWMSVEEVAKDYMVSPADVFTALGIDPAAGDQKLTLKIVGDKYHKSMPEIAAALNKLSAPVPNQDQNHHE
jgi:hypothetical protein